MPRIYLCFLWHMHQPFYKDLVSGQYKMPWTRLHALKDYYGMVHLLDEFPEIRQTFNLVPSLAVQIQEYASGQAADPFLTAALKPAEHLTQAEREFVLAWSFHASHRLIHRFPRYAELYEAWRAADRQPDRAARFFGIGSLRDLQVLSQLAWFDEEWLERDPEIRSLVEKGRDYSLDDQALLGRKQAELLQQVLPVYREFARRGQIEISTTPFYHPILPLLCDSDTAAISHPGLPLPPRFRYPEDAREQLGRARSYIAELFGSPPLGLWPSEGAVSDEALALAAEAGFQWSASDNGVLARTLGRPAGPAETYKPYLWRQGERRLYLIFRDHFLSDLVGFVYSRMGAAEAARDLLDRIRENCRPILASGRDALAPIILDGENAWEYYDRNGRPFLRELYRRISQDPNISAVTVSEALRKVPPESLDRIFPGSWINANFDIWIGHEEDNRAWEQLLRARQAYQQRASSLPEDRKALAYEELLIAEGSDWCWWFGPEHESANRPEFDELFRTHLANAWRALDLAPPEELSRPIIRIAAPELHTQPTGWIRPTIDGLITSYFEWLGAGEYRVDLRQSAMHGRRFLIRQLLYGCDAENLFLRLDLVSDGPTENLEARLVLEAARPG
ncbi:MAG: glycoside hydrolase family 57 protein, partial [Bryobacteraceae bacterium]|nr:glycoside hydrolase family 57 protein [Bryobacteraceae bacterium]